EVVDFQHFALFALSPSPTGRGVGVRVRPRTMHYDEPVPSSRPSGTFSRREKGKSPDGTFQTYFQQLLGLHRELHRQLAEHLLAEPVDDQRHRVFLADP